MAINPGSILFTSVLTDPDLGTGTEESFSFIATEFIASGEVIRFWDVDFSPSFVEYTVGPLGLNAFERVTFTEFFDSFQILNDPSGGAIGGSSGFNLVQDSALIASSFDGTAHQVIAAFNAGDPWDENMTQLIAAGGSRTAIDAYLLGGGSPSPVLSNVAQGVTVNDQNMMFAGTDIAGYDNLANWVGTDTNQTHANPNISGVTYATQDANIFCFAAGTLIAVENGESIVESLSVGDMVRAHNGELALVKWIGRQIVNARIGVNKKIEPVCIQAGALGNSMPHTDLTVSADHGMIIDGMVVNASALVNGTTIDFVPSADLADNFAYYHIETESHDIIFANGAPTETFVDIPGRMAFDNYQEYLDLYGAERIIPEMDCPRITSKRLLPESIKARLGIKDDALEFGDFENPRLTA